MRAELIELQRLKSLECSVGAEEDKLQVLGLVEVGMQLVVLGRVLG